MCGIAGVLSFGTTSFRVSPELVTAMRDTMVTRGPDGGETWVSPDGMVGLGHRRLSIIDLASWADQPMANEDDTLWLVFNGEIYNHAEIRSELERTGRHRWKTDHCSHLHYGTRVRVNCGWSETGSGSSRSIIASIMDG